MNEKKLVLIVEDDIHINKSLKTFLELEGFETRSAFDGEEAFGILNSGVKPDWILLDLMMPVMDGYEFLQGLKEKGMTLGEGALPIIIISAAPDAKRVADNYGLKALPKPIDLTLLLQWISKPRPSHP